MSLPVGGSSSSSRSEEIKYDGSKQPPVNKEGLQKEYQVLYEEVGEQVLQQRERTGEEGEKFEAKQQAGYEKLEQKISALDQKITGLSENATEADKEFLQTLKASLAALQNLVATLKGANLSNLSMQSIINLTEDAGINASEPILSKLLGMDGKVEESGNPFMARAFITTFFLYMQELSKVMLLNKDAEREVKVLGFENAWDFAVAAAEMAFKKGMNEAAKSMVQAVGGFINIGMTALTTSMMIHKVGDVKKEIETELNKNMTNPNAQFLDEGGKPADIYPKDVNGERGAAFNDAFDKKLNFDVTADRAPGITEMQNRIKALEKQNTNIQANEPPALGEELIQNAAEQQATIQANKAEIADLQDKISKKQEILNNTSVSQQLSSRLYTDGGVQALQAFTRSGEALQGIATGLGHFGLNIQSAEFEKNQQIFSAAQQLAMNMLQAALEAFTGESRAIEAVEQAKTQAAQTASKWSSSV